ncbi:MAG: hypothetical protein OXG56_03235 [Gammaproteobacteria bacterium]|nr:hypothetical protein [Gammaproteobacteria bacterium]
MRQYNVNEKCKVKFALPFFQARKCHSSSKTAWLFRIKDPAITVKGCETRAMHAWRIF